MAGVTLNVVGAIATVAVPDTIPVLERLRPEGNAGEIVNVVGLDRHPVAFSNAAYAVETE